MNSKGLFHQSQFRRVDLRVSPGTHPSDRFLPILVGSDLLQEIKIYCGDIIYANLSLLPSEGELTAIETMQGVLLGYLFTTLTEYILIESVCRCRECPPQLIHPSSVLSLGPIRKLSRQRGNVSLAFS